MSQLHSNWNPQVEWVPGRPLSRSGGHCETQGLEQKHASLLPTLDIGPKQIQMVFNAFLEGICLSMDLLVSTIKTISRKREV